MRPAAWMSDPPWFLVTGLPWPEDHAGSEIAEAAFAIAPDVTRVVRPASADGTPVPLGADLALVLDAGARCAAALRKRVIFLSDITGWLADTGLSWERAGVSCAAAQSELEQQPLGLFITVSARVYTILCSTTRSLAIHSTAGRTAEIPPGEREMVRASLEARLDADWPGFVTTALASAQLACPPRYRRDR
jgi:hypothetical protein